MGDIVTEDELGDVCPFRWQADHIRLAVVRRTGGENDC